MLSGNRDAEDEEFKKIQHDFIIASREAQFLFPPKSGVYDYLLQLNKDSFKITGHKNLPQNLSPEFAVAQQQQFANALMRWNEGMEPLEGLMAPYLNYHYATATEAIAGRMKQQWSRMWASAHSFRVKPGHRDI